MFPNLYPLCLSLQFGGFSVITGMLARFGFDRKKQRVNTNVTVACEDLTLLSLIILAPKQKKQSNNKVYAGVREKEMSG